MRHWLLLALAILCEVVATSTLKATDSFSKLLPSLVVIGGYGAAFYLMSKTLTVIPVGIAYAVWSGLGVALVLVVAWVLYGQKIDSWGLVGVSLILGGILVLNLLSKTTH